MSVGVVMLVHTAFDRAEQAVRHWVAGGCPVVVHVDKDVDRHTYDTFVAALSDLDHVLFSKRHRCEWGGWGLVAASQAASTLLLEQFPDVRHAFLASGSCLPLRPIAELRAYLDARPDTDFIESATTADVPWTVGGLDRERFTLRFPFSWKRQRWLFDRYVQVQQLVRLRRRIPEGIVPHMGSQWWCLTRSTLQAILNDPRRKRFDAYFKLVWIPDESYYQTLSRCHARKIESRSLTLSKFDFQGKPHIFYDDHRELLLRSGCFVARKIWPHADELYATFPVKIPSVPAQTEPAPATIDRLFASAVDRRLNGRQGLFMQSRFPNTDREKGIAATPYAVFQGLDDLFPDFTDWLSRRSGAEIHGHLFAKDRVHFSDEASTYRGALSDNARLRDYNGRMFLTNLLWAGREKTHGFQFGPADSQDIRWMIAKDAQARIWVVSGAWAVPLFLSGRSAADVRAEAARLQRIENKFLKILRSSHTRARIEITTLADFMQSPMDMLQDIIDDIAGHRGQAVTEVPKMADLSGLAGFLQDLKNQGMHPFLTGEFTGQTQRSSNDVDQPKPYVVGGK
ncbi:beta-1,6-N-acetylglucosaminyltransferase [Yoonia sp. BS5-3]|uniref:Peptide O-xylosyltransferase n=1 Tax=Yoonia phaeophyticola TaxID=3137369 RepID=A0ABZ2VAD0_9RHOB